MEKALVGFSFDDGREDTYLYGYPILKKYHLPATFNITTGFIEGVDSSFVPSYVKPMTIDMLKDLFSDSDMEIAGHGYKHINSLENIIHGIKSLCQILGTSSLYKGENGFASPYTGLSLSSYRQIKVALNNNHIPYVRLSLRYLLFVSIKTYIRKISRIIKWPFLYKIAYSDTLMDSVEDDVIYSIPVLSTISFSQLHSVIKKAISEKKACVLMFHGIVPKGGSRDNWEFEEDKFDALCHLLSEYQKRGFLKGATSMDIYHELKV